MKTEVIEFYAKKPIRKLLYFPQREMKFIKYREEKVEKLFGFIPIRRYPPGIWELFTFGRFSGNGYIGSVEKFNQENHIQIMVGNGVVYRKRSIEIYFEGEDEDSSVTIWESDKETYRLEDYIENLKQFHPEIESFTEYHTLKQGINIYEKSGI